MFTKIMVPLDGSLRAEQAIPVAGRIARTSSASILLLRVVEVPIVHPSHFAEPPLSDEEAAQKKASDYLKQVAQSDALKGIGVEISVVFGSAADMVLETAETSRPDLIVMCSHGYTGLKRWMLGSVADRVIRHMPVPTLILHEHGPAPLASGAVNPVPLQALVPVDGSELAEEVLTPTWQLLMALAPDTPKELHLLRVVGLPAIAGVGKSQAHITSGIIAEAKQEAMDYVAALIQRLRQEIPPSAQITIGSTVELDTDVAEAILKETEESGEAGEDGYQGYNMIAMATHGRSGIRRWMMGSVTERVLHHSSVPLFIVRPQKLARQEEGEVDTDKQHAEAEQRAEFGEFPSIL